MQLERLNLKIQSSLQHLQDLSAQKQVLDHSEKYSQFLRISQTDMFIRNLMKTTNMLN